VNASADTFVAPALTEVVGAHQRRLALRVVARDGVPVADDSGHRQYVDLPPSKPLLLAPGNRVEILVRAPAAGGKLYLDSETVLVGCAGDGNPPARLLLVKSSGAPVAATAADDRDIAPRGTNARFTHILSAAPTVTRRLAFIEFPRSFSTDHTLWPTGAPRQVDPNAVDFYLVQTDASDGSGRPVLLKPFHGGDSAPHIEVHLRGQEQRTEEWTIQNYTPEIHAFHMHQFHFRVMSADPAQDFPLLDVVTVPAATLDKNLQPNIPGEVKIRLTFTRALSGEFVFHCHILNHEDNGMMGKLLVAPD
jgi:FtsP/CotA-like multicopper oxidase with cupredoxin domain